MTTEEHAVGVPAGSSLPPVRAQVERLVTLGLVERAGLTGAELRSALPDEAPGALVIIRPARLPVSAVAPLLERDGKAGFVVVDMADVDAFAPIAGLEVPTGAAYLVRDLDRGDTMANWSPDEALPAILGAGRTPLTALEGALWVLQQPAVLERNRCFMTIGSRIHKANGTLDARTPALWISNGTGRDGRERRGAAKLGWCWAGNRHTWLGFASAAERGSYPA